MRDHTQFNGWEYKFSHGNVDEIEKGEFVKLFELFIGFRLSARTLTLEFRGWRSATRFDNEKVDRKSLHYVPTIKGQKFKDLTFITPLRKAIRDFMSFNNVIIKASDFSIPQCNLHILEKGLQIELSHKTKEGYSIIGGSTEDTFDTDIVNSDFATLIPTIEDYAWTYAQANSNRLAKFSKI